MGILVAAHIVFAVIPGGKVVNDQAIRIERRACGQSYIGEVVNPVNGQTILGRVTVRCGH